MAELKDTNSQQGFVPSKEEPLLHPGYTALRKGMIYTHDRKVYYESKAADGQTFDFNLFPIGGQIVSESIYEGKHDEFVANLIKRQIKPTEQRSEDINEAINIIKEDWQRLEPYLVVDAKDEQKQSKTKVKTSMIDNVLVAGRQIPLVIVREGVVILVKIAEKKDGFLSEKDVQEIAKVFPSVKLLNAQYSKGPSQIPHIDFVAGRK